MNLAELQDSFTAHDNHVNVFSKIIQERNPIGILFIQSDLTGFQQRLYLYIVTVFGVMFISLILTSLLAGYLQNIITQPVYNLLHVMTTVTREKNYTLRAPKTVNDEIGKLIDGFNEMLANIAARDQEIRILNKQLTEENSRMGAELDITRRLQQMVLPTTNELQQVEGLDIAGFMEPADEVGGDYYDVLQHDGRVKIGIGDVTGHGLESGVVMLMVQMAVRTLLTNNVTDPKAFLAILNRAVFDNVHRMQSDKNLTLTLLDYEAGVLRFVGQHEDILLVRQNGKVECIDTLNLGFMVGLVREISDFLVSEELNLAIGEGIVLYTDGITEARDDEGNLFGLERLCDVIQAHWQLSAKKIQQAIISDVLRHINGYKIADDITLLVIKRMA
ncbi:SpoIIE family protein phosphatase [Beggiatoa leptomitoformis]|uniref:SpoIIE family protein phosphatase n=2 Tax=Beggiatoa leptomitoformis TaxID=288004 RepID=A0A2N9YI85_9GAMM|nr:SpoIIE family protein phosphatase [Beggiatoa leptomitoformis]QGX03623.1 SpoIIE family protein phosphatase [Beggiatoa leptomitoformis]